MGVEFCPTFCPTILVNTQRLYLCSGGPDPQRHDVATAQLTAHGYVEQPEIARVAGHPKIDPDGPDTTRPERVILPHEAAAVPSDASGTDGGKRFDRHRNLQSTGPHFLGHADPRKMRHSKPRVATGADVAPDFYPA